MKWLLWIPCRSVWVHVGSCFIQRLSSCFSPTSLAFDCTTFVLLMMTMRKKKQRPRKRRSKRTRRREKPRGLWTNHHQQTQAEGKVCVTLLSRYSCVCLCFDLYLFFRAEHTCMLWWTASMVSWWLHSAAWRRSSTGRVRSGPCFAFLLCRWVFTHTQTQKHTENKLSVSTVTTLELPFIDWQSEFGGFTCYVANEEDEEVSVDHSIKCNCSCVRYTVFQWLSLPWFLPRGSFWQYIQRIIPSPSSTETKKPSNLSNTSTTKAPLILPTFVPAEHCMTSLLCTMNKQIYSSIVWASLHVCDID